MPTATLVADGQATALESKAAQNMSELQKARLEHALEIPDVLLLPHALKDADERTCVGNHDEIVKLFPNLTAGGLHMAYLEPASAQAETETANPLRIGVVLSGGQAAGGHNVIIGIYEYLQKRHPGSTLIGFTDGPRGILQGNYKELSAADMALFRNQGGFHMLCSGRDKIEKPEQLQAAVSSCINLELDGLVVIGGDDSNTNAAVLAEHFAGAGIKTRVIGVPKTLDGDLKNDDVAISFGFDTACKVYSELIGNIMIDCASAKKYTHFIRLMGRAASHVTLECALQTHPQWAFISEEIAAKHLSIKDCAKKVADIVVERCAMGKPYGVFLLPEGLVEYVYDVSALISELNELMAHGTVSSSDLAAVSAALTPESRECFDALPAAFQHQLMEDRDPHGNVQVAHIESEKLLLQLVEAELAARKAAGTFNGKFAGLSHYFGYEGRCAMPSNFDCAYCYALGQAAGALLGAGKTGLMATIGDLKKPAKQWKVGGTPLVSMMNLERRHGKDKPVIKKALVELEGAPFKAYCNIRDAWAVEDAFRSPGPIQFKGHTFADVGTITLAEEVNEGHHILISATSDVADC